MTTFNETFDTVTPAGGADPAEADDRMRETKAAIQERLNVEHVFDLTGTQVSHANTGQHKGINCTSIINAGALTNTGNFTLNTDKFTIDAATGNVVVAGTLSVAGAAEVTGVATLGDASLLKTSAAPTTDPMIANKKYVDDNIGSANWTPTSYAGEESIAFPNGLILKMGVENINGNSTERVSFAAAFPTGIVVGFADSMENNPAADPAQVYAVNVAYIDIVNGSGSAQDCQWMAWGY